jgi:hypothetical protein
MTEALKDKVARHCDIIEAASSADLPCNGAGRFSISLSSMPVWIKEGLSLKRLILEKRGKSDEATERRDYAAREWAHTNGGL